MERGEEERKRKRRHLLPRTLVEVGLGRTELLVQLVLTPMLRFPSSTQPGDSSSTLPFTACRAMPSAQSPALLSLSPRRIPRVSEIERWDQLYAVALLFITSLCKLKKEKRMMDSCEEEEEEEEEV